MVTKSKKEQIVAELVEILKDASGIYVVNFATMTVAETNAFRGAIRSKGLVYKVAKNTLIKRAFAELNINSIPEKSMFGQSGLLICKDDPTVGAKVIKEVSEKSQKPQLKAAVLDGQYFDGSKLQELAKLPSKQDLIAGILGSLNAPASGIVGAINAVMRDLASVIEEVAKKNNAA